MRIQNQKVQTFVEKECSCSNYYCPGSNHLSAKSTKFYLNVHPVILQEDSYYLCFFLMNGLKSICVEILDASNNTKIIPDSGGKCDHYMKVCKNIVFGLLLEAPRQVSSIQINTH